MDNIIGPVEPLPLYLKDKETVVAYACGVCKVVAGKNTSEGYEDAAYHCRHKLCANGCGEPARYSGSYGGPCRTCQWESWNKSLAEKEQEAFSAAPKISWRDYRGEGYVFLGNGIGPDDGYFEDLGTMAEYFYENPEFEKPTYAWDCTPYGLSFDAADIISDAFEHGEHHEDAADWLERGAYEALQEALDRWVKNYASGVRSWRENNTAILLDGFWEEEEDE